MSFNSLCHGLRPSGNTSRTNETPLIGGSEAGRTKALYYEKANEFQYDLSHPTRLFPLTSGAFVII
jgi:hypothetical protein